MTDETRAKLAELLAKGYPDWWVVLTLNGFTSHLNVPSAMEVLNKHKIFLVKEEGDASETNQPYDQVKAKTDKKSICNLLDVCRLKIKNITQWI
jgi:hypothetical protein